MLDSVYTSRQLTSSPNKRTGPSGIWRKCFFPSSNLCIFIIKFHCKHNEFYYNIFVHHCTWCKMNAFCYMCIIVFSWKLPLSSPLPHSKLRPSQKAHQALVPPSELPKAWPTGYWSSGPQTCLVITPPPSPTSLWELESHPATLCSLNLVFLIQLDLAYCISGEAY